MNIGPNITKDGLVLYYDAANIKSFRGEPTTNYITDPTTMIDWTSYTNGNDGVFTTEFGTIGYQIIHKPSWNGIYKHINVSGGTYTISAYFRYLGGTTANNGATVYTSGGGISDSAVGINKSLIGVWQRVSMTNTYSGSFGVYFISYGGNPNDDWSSWEVTMPQVEQKDYVTPFVDGTRGNTIATGGGIVDISIKNNSSVNFSNVLYNKNNNGVFNFIGSGTALNTGNLDLSYTKSVSMSFWFKTSSSSSQILLELTGNFNNYSGSFLVNMNEYGVGTMSIGMHSSEGYNVVRTNTSGLNDNIWHHFVGIMDKGRNTNPQTQIYIDGISNYKDTGHNVILTSYFNNLPLYVGSRNNTTSFYNGSLSQIMIYDRVLSQTEVATIYNNQKSRYI